MGKRMGKRVDKRKTRTRTKNIGPFRKKVCKFCLEKVETIDYKDTGRLSKYTTERGKIIPARVSGVCAPSESACPGNKKGKDCRPASFCRGVNEKGTKR